jgi:hypothetical protein
MHEFLTSGRRRYALLLFVVGAGSLALMGASCAPAPTKPPAPANDLSIDPVTWDFGQLGGVSLPKTFTVTNNGSDTSGPLAVELQGGTPSAFDVPVAGDDCTGAELGPGDSCDVDAVFAPLSDVPFSTNLVVTGDPGGTATAALSGTGEL